MVKKKRKASAIRRLHRSLGAFAAIFVLFMVLSGLAINHSNGLGLDQRRVSLPLLLDWYGLGGPETLHSFQAGNDWLSFAGSQLYLNDKSVATMLDGIGAVSSNELLIAAGREELLLLDHDGQPIERLPWTPIGMAPIESIGLHNNATVVVKSAGQTWLADADLLDWQPTEGNISDPLWSMSEPAPEDIQQAIRKSYRGDGLSMERILLDLHSGRVFGTIGVLVYDLLALTIGFLSISGLVLWFRGRRNGKGKNRK